MEEILNATVPEKVEVVDIQFRPGQKIYYFAPGGLSLQAGDRVIIDTARGEEFGIVAAGNHEIAGSEVVSPLRSVIRLATERDEKILAENRAKEKRAHDLCLQKIAEHGLDMQLVSAECAFDGSKILFFFTADERVDFRELVKNLASAFHTRIELRQIGVRDKAKMVGGLGICGRPFCCASFLDDFQPVSIKMAKTQNLSLNPTKISGTCGRLMCCLKYEQDAYEDLLKHTPKEDSFVDTPEGRGVITEVSLLRQKVKVRMESDPETISQFRVDEIAVWRNGKPKKNDEPAPADWAPISGSGKRVRRLEKIDEPKLLDPIRFRYSQEAIVEEPAAPVTEDPTEEKSGKNRSRRSRGNRQKNRQEEVQQLQQDEPKQEKPKQEKPKQKPKQNKAEPAEKAEAAPAEAGEKKSGGHRNHHRRHYRKPKQNKAE
jgi:cell fate regulator YaaT (PSP1 superfamily)